jgi:hypothetical protein
VAEEGGPYTLFKVVAVPVVQGGEQAGPRVAWERGGHVLRRVCWCLQAYLTRGEFVPRLENPGLGSSNSRTLSSRQGRVMMCAFRIAVPKKDG